jgi:hypothetical protein
MLHTDAVLSIYCTVGLSLIAVPQFISNGCGNAIGILRKFCFVISLTVIDFIGSE